MQYQTHDLLPIIGDVVGMCMLTLPKTMLVPSCGIFFGGQLRAIISHDFDKAMALIKKEKIEAYNWLERELQWYTWSMYAYDINCKVERTDNNASECFNSWILPYRDRLVLSVLEEIRCRLMKRFTKRRNEANAWAKIVAQRIYKELDKTYKKGEKMIVHHSEDLNFQVMDKSYYPARKFVMKLEDKTCNCGYWEIAGYINTYSVMFSQIPDEHTWERGERPLIDPLIVQKKIRRPKKCRKRAATEPKKHSRRFFVNCSVYGGSNHNVRFCQLRPSIASAARARSNNSQVCV